MRKLLTPLLLFTFCFLKTVAQPNHVSNGSFEYYSACPSNLGQIQNCYGWYNFSSSDFFHLCYSGTYTSAHIYNNNFGTQLPADGLGYAGANAYYAGAPNSQREYFNAEIIPLVAGRRYEVAASVSLGDISGCGVTGIGVHFYKNAVPAFSFTSGPLSVLPQIDYSGYGPIINTTGWVRVSGSFIADSSYDKLIIGNFKADSNLIIETIGPSPGRSYYFYDSIVVRHMKKVRFDFADTMFCVGDSVIVPYFADTDSFATTNVFTLQLSDSAGSFVSPISLATTTSRTSGTLRGVLPSSTLPGSRYRLRIVSSSPSDESYDNGRNITISNVIPGKPVATGNTPVCAGASVNLSASSSSTITSWVWAGPDGFNSKLQSPSVSGATVAASGNYIVKGYLLGCYSKDTISITVNPLPAVISAGYNGSASNPVCELDSLKLFASTTVGASYSWTGPTSFVSTLEDPIVANISSAAAGTYRVTVTTSAGCSRNDSVVVHTKVTPIVTAGANMTHCEAETLSFTASANASGSSYSWTGPNGFSSSIANPFLNNANTTHSGNFVVTASLNGCSHKDTTVVTIKPLPPLSASSNSPVCEGSNLNLIATTATTSASYSWTGPNSYSSSTKNPVISNITSVVAGKYYVTGTLNGCAKNDSVTVQTKTTPFVSASNNGPICESGNLALTATTSVTGASFSWIGPNSYTGTGQTTTINPVTTNGAGTYIVTANLNGCIDTGVTTVSVLTQPAISSISSNSPVCLLDTIKLFSTASTGATPGWTGPASFSATSANPIITSASVANDGYYVLTVTGTNGCIRTDSVNVVTKPLPVSTASNTGPVCAGDPLGLNVSTTYTGVSFQWTGPNSFSSTAANPTISNPPASASGTYTVTASMNGCSYAATTSATVHPIPVAQAGAQLPVCVGGTIQLNGNSLAGATYQWTGPSYSSTQQSPSFPATSTTQSGNYILVITANGCVSEPDTVNVKVNVLSRIGGYASPNDTICQGTIPTFVAFVQDGGPAPVAQWYKNHTPVGASNALQYTPSTINNGDIYYCKLTAPGVCYTTLILYTDTIDMTVLPVVTKPEVTITANPGLHVRPSDLVKFTAIVKHGGTSPKYQWYKNGIKQTGAITATFDATGLSYMDMIHVDIISEDPCAQDKNASDTVWMQFPAGIKDVSKSSIKLYPNPNNGSFTISGIAATEAEVEVINAIGQIVYSKKVQVVNNSVEVTAGLSPGVYQIRVAGAVLRFSTY